MPTGLQFYYCKHYHISDARLPCWEYRHWDARTIFELFGADVAKLRRKSQKMLNSRKVFLQTMKEV
jgi:hypothetical protein